MENVLFWNVDTQKDFMNKDGKLYVQKAEKIKPKLKELTELAIENDITVISTADWHYKDSKELSINPDFINTFPEHCMISSTGAEFIDETKPTRSDLYKVYWDSDYSFDDNLIQRQKDIIIYKDEFDVFAGSPHTDKILQILKPKTVIVYGVATNVCVHFAVIGLLQRNYNVIVVKDAIKELPNIPSPIEEWQEKGAKIYTLKRVKGLVKK